MANLDSGLCSSPLNVELKIIEYAAFSPDLLVHDARRLLPSHVRRTAAVDYRLVNFLLSSRKYFVVDSEFIKLDLSLDDGT